ncbi:MAG TPA: hypothetical protein VFA33_28270 [Bryobacteraceae bacterium]|nr:hypothetical protein [Bryobacteraceae bacterium]
MKCIFVLILTAAAISAADFNTGQAARAVVGQITFTQGDDGASDVLLGAAGGVAYANNTLFVADGSRSGATPVNNRVLIYQNVAGWLPSPSQPLNYDRKCPVCVGDADVVVGQPDFTHTDIALSQTGMRTPTAVASDGIHLVVADTDNNRVLIWNSIPTVNGAPADVVVGQPDFKTGSIPPGNVPTAQSMRGPQGVWIQNGKLFVADTQNHRVLIYNSIPTSNGAAADLVLGQPNLTTFVEPDLTQAKQDAEANNLLNPVSVTSDGQRLYVTDLGHHRVLIWNTIPTANQAPADVVIGQPDMTSSLSNNSYSVAADGTESQVLCASNGTDSNGKPTFPQQCNATLSFPRFALSDGQRLFIADGGNDRVLVFEHIPTQNGASADYVIGQLGGQINQASDAVDSLRTPSALAWDGTNLYVADAYNRRVNVYSPAANNVPYTGVRNAASFDIFAVGEVTLGGNIQADDTVTITINSKDYTYKVLKTDDLTAVVNGLVKAINADSGDPNVLATGDPTVYGVILTSRVPGSDGNKITLAASTSANALITATASGANLSGGQDAAKIGPGTVVSVLGSNLSDASAQADSNADTLPDTLANTQVYFNGIRAPLFFVSPNQINAQIPFEFTDTTSVNAYVRTVHADGSVTVTTPVAVSIVQQNPGIFTSSGGNDPRPAVALHSSSNATGTISVDGSVKAGDVATVTIGDPNNNPRTYSYTVQSSDTLATIRDALISQINQDPQVEASPAGVFTRIRLKARVSGPDGNGIPYTGSASSNAQVILTATTPALCCANTAGAPITDDNPALAGETIVVYATGLGVPNPPDGASTGQKFYGPVDQPQNFVSSLAGGKTANVLAAQLKTGMIGVWEVDLELNSSLPSDPLTQLTIAQDVYVSNIVTVPVYNPNPSSP